MLPSGWRLTLVNSRSFHSSRLKDDSATDRYVCKMHVFHWVDYSSNYNRLTLLIFTVLSFDVGRRPKDNFSTPYPAVSYTHLTLPTKRIV